MPAPNVDSAVIKIDIEKKFDLDLKQEQAFFKFIKAAFAQRRKTLPNTLSSQLPYSSAQIAQAMQDCGLKPTARAEELSLGQMVELSLALSSL